MFTDRGGTARPNISLGWQAILKKKIEVTEAHITEHVVWQTEGILTGPDSRAVGRHRGAGRAWRMRC